MSRGGEHGRDDAGRHLLVNLWSGPRNVSTSLMYAFRERADTTVVDEPLYAAYLVAHPEQDGHPGRDEVLARQPHDPARVLRWLVDGPCSTPVLFAKHMASHLELVTDALLDRARNVVLVRAPEAVVASYSAHVDQPTPQRLGYPAQLSLVRRELAHGRTPVVLETNRLLADPAGVLARACRRLGIVPDRSMLSWPAGPVPEDGAWAPWWYASTHRSTGFGPPRPERDETIGLPDHLADVAAACRPLYEQLVAHAL